MARALEDTFPAVEIRTDEDRRRRWKLRDPGLARFQGVRDDEVAALEMSIRRAEREGAGPDVAALAALRDRLLACMPGPHARRAEADAEALMEAQGFAASPGPVVRAAPGVLETIAEALKGPFPLAITYAGADGIAADRRPGQRLEDQPDGSLVVRFEASGWLEMAWHLYQWGDAVEVLAPEGLRAMVERHRRSDFEAMP